MHLYGDLVYVKGLFKELWIRGIFNGTYVEDTRSTESIVKGLVSRGLSVEDWEDFCRKNKGRAPVAEKQGWGEVMSLLVDCIRTAKTAKGPFISISCSPDKINYAVSAITVAKSSDGFWSLLQITDSDCSYYKDKYVLFSNDAINPQMFILIRPMEGEVQSLESIHEGMGTFKIKINSKVANGRFVKVFNLKQSGATWFCTSKNGTMIKES